MKKFLAFLLLLLAELAQAADAPPPAGRYRCDQPPGTDRWPRRHTMVLTKRADTRPGSASWVKLPQCYLTEH